MSAVMNATYAESETPRAPGSTEQLLTFQLDGQEYGISVLKVQEIKGWEKVTPIPNSPPYIRGVLNLRGLIVPVLDLRLRFGLPEIPYTSITAIVVVNIGNRLTGLVVDSVSDVIDVSEDQQREAPNYEGHKNREFIRGLAHIDGKLLILLEVNCLTSTETLDAVSGSEAVVSRP